MNDEEEYKDWLIMKDYDLTLWYCYGCQKITNHMIIDGFRTTYCYQCGLEENWEEKDGRLYKRNP